LKLFKIFLRVFFVAVIDRMHRDFWISLCKLSMKCLALGFTRFLQVRQKISAYFFLLALRMSAAKHSAGVQNMAHTNKASRAAICEEGT
jgi:hypothetical protein